jgi:hypothetical protein
VGGDRDLLIQDGFRQDEMYEQIFRLRRQMKAIKKILEVSDEKNVTDDSNTSNNRM